MSIQSYSDLKKRFPLDSVWLRDGKAAQVFEHKDGYSAVFLRFVDDPAFGFILTPEFRDKFLNTLVPI